MGTFHILAACKQPARVKQIEVKLSAARQRKSELHVIPAKAGIQIGGGHDSRFRGSDENANLSEFELHGSEWN